MNTIRISLRVVEGGSIEKVSKRVRGSTIDGSRGKYNWYIDGSSRKDCSRRVDSNHQSDTGVGCTLNRIPFLFLIVDIC